MLEATSTFRTDEPLLHEVLAEIAKGNIQLPFAAALAAL